MKFSRLTLPNLALYTSSLIIISYGLNWSKAILIPFTIAFFLYLITSLFDEYLQRKVKIGKKLSLIITVLTFFILFSTAMIFILISLRQFFDEFHLYRSKLQMLSRMLNNFLEPFNIYINLNSVKSLSKNIPLMDYVKIFSGGLFDFISNSFLIFLLSIFLLIGDKPKFTLHRLYIEARDQISYYMKIKIYLSLISSTIIFLVCLFTDIELSFLIFFVTFIFNFIPTLGPLLSILIPIPIIVIQFGFDYHLWLLLSVIAVVQFVIWNVLETKIMDKSLGIHPFAFFMALAYWGFVWGFPGMFLSIPLTLTLSLVINYIEAKNSTN